MHSTFRHSFKIEKRKWLFLVCLVALTHLFCQTLMLPYGNALLSLLPGDDGYVSKKIGRSSSISYMNAVNVDEPRSVGALDLESAPLLVHGVRAEKNFNSGRHIKDDLELLGKGKRDLSVGSDGEGVDGELDFDFVEDETLDDDSPLEVNSRIEDGFKVQTDGGRERDLMLGNWTGESEHSVFLLQMGNGSSVNNVSETNGTIMEAGKQTNLLIKTVVQEGLIYKLNTSIGISSDQTKEISAGKDHEKLSVSSNGSLVTSKHIKKKMRCEMPPKTVTSIDEMQRLFVRHRARSRAMRPRWSSECDREVLAARLSIQNAPILKDDDELYAPAFRNISMFKRSYELMQRTLKIYVYKEGEKPIFHTPVLKGLYASEGWFMKLMEGNKNFLVKDPRKAHLFYMPFSSRMLEYNLYVRNSHDRTNLRQYLKEYSEMIAAKYRFWNRTDGADHFLVACHDWAPYETRHHMEHCIKALCNADVTMGFKIGRDVSLPETYVRSARNPQRDLGGKPPSQRHILAFYAGSMHGYLRPILLKHWKDRDPDMKIFGRMPLGVASKMNYIHHMKSSRYCICPKGYEVNSPRVVEAIFYECVPVIISDNFVPPFFEVLNWNAFSVIIAEKDIPNLKDILLSIPEEKYLNLQLGVRKVQKHFLWHAKPLKYDLFHMTLHSIWYNRVFQIKAR